MALSATRYAIVGGTTECYRCHQQTPVVAIALPPETRTDHEEPYEHGWLNAVEIADLPAAASRHLCALPGGENYTLDFSITAGERYVLNHCNKCGAKLGDHFMHSEPDGPFFGEATEGLQVQMINEQITLDCGYSEGGLGLWLQDQLEREGRTQ